MVISVIIDILSTIILYLEPHRHGNSSAYGRKIALAITNIEQGLMWLKAAEVDGSSD